MTSSLGLSCFLLGSRGCRVRPLGLHVVLEIQVRGPHAPRNAAGLFLRGVSDAVSVHDYWDQYNDYCHFFKELNENHPAAKDLTKTSTFREWKKRQLNCVETDTGTETETFEPEEGEIAPPDRQPPDTQAEPEEYLDILEAPVHEIQPPAIDINNLDDRIQQIIDNLQEDDAQRRLLNEDDHLAQDADEGIELDVETELQAIIEPFDYELEIDF